MVEFKEAYKKLLKEYPDKIARKYIEYNGRYVFLLVPKKNPNTPVLDAFYAVNKKTGKIEGYQPTNDKNADKFFKLWTEKDEEDDDDE